MRKTPYSNLTTPMAILKYVALDQKRPPLEAVSKECPKDLILVMQKCWVHEPSKRPDFRHIICKLKDTKDKIFK